MCEAYELQVVEDGDREAAFAIREAVFVNEQGVAKAIEFDEYDQHAETVHLLATHNESPVGTARFRVISEDESQQVGKIERVAVYKHRRGEGIGTKLIKTLEDYARSPPVSCSAITIYAQKRVVAFYRQLGYRETGEQFERVGIPHVVLEKSLE